MPVTPMGLTPSEPFPPGEAVAPLDARNLHDVSDLPVSASTKQPTRAFRGTTRTAKPSFHRSCKIAASSSRHGTSPESVVRRAGVSRTGTRCSPGVRPLQGFATTDPGADASTHSPPVDLFAWTFHLTLRRGSSPGQWPFGVSLGSETADWLSPVRQPS
jgi:hypothetical protein